MTHRDIVFDELTSWYPLSTPKISKSFEPNSNDPSVAKTITIKLGVLDKSPTSLKAHNKPKNNLVITILGKLGRGAAPNTSMASQRHSEDSRV
jgi:hypothetical protein